MSIMAYRIKNGTEDQRWVAMDSLLKMAEQKCEFRILELKNLRESIIVFGTDKGDQPELLKLSMVRARKHVVPGTLSRDFGMSISEKLPDCGNLDLGEPVPA